MGVYFLCVPTTRGPVVLVWKFKSNLLLACGTLYRCFSVLPLVPKASVYVEQIFGNPRHMFLCSTHNGTPLMVVLNGLAV